jgi:hypothetical protein
MLLVRSSVTSTTEFLLSSKRSEESQKAKNRDSLFLLCLIINLPKVDFTKHSNKSKSQFFKAFSPNFRILLVLFINYMFLFEIC